MIFFYFDFLFTFVFFFFVFFFIFFLKKEEKEEGKKEELTFPVYPSSLKVSAANIPAAPPPMMTKVLLSSRSHFERWGVLFPFFLLFINFYTVFMFFSVT